MIGALAGIERLRSALKRWTRGVLHALLSSHRQIDWSAILACPACRADVAVVAEEVRCMTCHRRYPIEQGVPIMLVDQARLPSGGSSTTGCALLATQEDAWSTSVSRGNGS